MIFKRKKSDSPSLSKPIWLRVSGYSLVVVLLLMIGVAWYWSRTPDVIWVEDKANGDRTVIGYATTDTLIRVAETLLDKPGGYLTNDMTPPSVFLDNIPNWEYRRIAAGS